MTYYIRCPHCGDLIETTNFIPENVTCFKCGMQYKVTDRNSMKRPPYDLFYCVGLVMVGIGGYIAASVLNGYAPASDLAIAVTCVLGALGIGQLTDRIRKRIERSVRQIGMERMRRRFQFTRTRDIR